MRAFYCILPLPYVTDAIAIQRAQLLGRGGKRKGGKRGVGNRSFPSLHIHWGACGE
jgi:hypothetical protein